MRIQKKKQKGFTLIELLLVVGIMAVGAIIAYYTLPKVQSTSNANTEATLVNTLAAGIKNVYSGTNNFRTLTNKVLIDAKAVPDKMLTTTANELVNSFGGQVTITPTKLGTVAVDKTAYQIESTNIPDAECTKIAAGVGNNFGEVSVNGTKVRTYPSTEPIDPAVTSAACVATANTIILIGS